MLIADFYSDIKISILIFKNDYRNELVSTILICTCSCGNINLQMFKKNVNDYNWLIIND